MRGLLVTCMCTRNRCTNVIRIGDEDDDEVFTES